MARRKTAVSGKSGWPLPIFLFLVLLILNAFLVSSHLGWYDFGEMVGTTVCLGISHPSGQVLFHLLGKLFLLVPFSTPAWRLGFMSVACSSLASALFWVLCRRLAARVLSYQEEKLPATLEIWLTLLTLAWSFSLPWWRYSLIPLVYALHLLLGFLVLWALSLERPGKWALVFFLLGISTIFRPTQFFAVPFVVAAYLYDLNHQALRLARGSLKATRKTKGIRANIKEILYLIVSLMLGRSTVLYLPLRSALHPAMAYADLTHPLALVRHVLALKFSHSVGANSLSNVLHVAGMMLSHFWTDLTPFGLMLLVWGMAAVYWKREQIPVFLWVGLGWGLVEVLFVFTIPFPTFESHQMILGWAFGGLLAVLPLAYMEQILRKGQYRSWKLVGSLALAALVVVQLSQTRHFWQRKADRSAEDYAHNLLLLMGPNALYVPSEENEYFPVAGYQQSTGFRGDVGIIEPGTDPALVKPRIEETLRQGRPLYVTRKWDLPEGWAYRSRGPLLQVVPVMAAGALKKAPASKPLAAWGGLELLGVELWPDRVAAGGIIQVTYRWVRRKASAQDSSNMVVALFIDPQGKYRMKNGVFWLHDIHEVPEGSLNRMKPGMLYEEQRILMIPSDFPPGSYALAVGLQKQPPEREEGKEPFTREFYERNSFQSLDKFLGRGENGAVVQFSAEGEGSWKDGLWPVTKSLYPIADPRFVPVAEVQIQAGN